MRTFVCEGGAAGGAGGGGEGSGGREDRVTEVRVTNGEGQLVAIFSGGVVSERGEGGRSGRVQGTQVADAFFGGGFGGLFEEDADSGLVGFEPGE